MSKIILMLLVLSGISQAKDISYVWSNSSDREMEDIAYCSSRSVYVGFHNDAIYISNDATNWQLQSGLTNTSVINRVECRNSNYFLVGKNGTLITSGDGITFTKVTLPETKYVYEYKGIAYGNGLYILVGDDGSNGVILTSKDAITWEMKYIDGEQNDYSIKGKKFVDIEFWNGKFYISNGENIIYTTTDGTALTTNNYTGTTIKDIFVGDGYLVAYSNTELYHTKDGIFWALSTLTNKKYGSYAGSYGNGYYMVSVNDSKIATSTNLVDWNVSEALPFPTYNIIYDGKKFVANGPNGVLTSSESSSTSTISTSKILTKEYISSLRSGWSLIGTAERVTDVSIFDSADKLFIYNNDGTWGDKNNTKSIGEFTGIWIKKQ